VQTEHIKTSNQGWYFRGCNDCNLKCDGVAPPFVCKKGHSTDDPLIKYASTLILFVWLIYHMMVPIPMYTNVMLSSAFL
jgi:hypothetical protein